MPRKKKDNLISLAKKTNDASKFSTRDLLIEITDSDIPEEFDKCLCILANEQKTEDGATHKFNYYTAGYKSRLELLGVLQYIESLILSELEG